MHNQDADQNNKEIIIKLEKVMSYSHYNNFIIDTDDLIELIYQIKKGKDWCYNCLNNLNKQEIELDLNRCFNCNPEYKRYYKQVYEKLD